MNNNLFPSEPSQDNFKTLIEKNADGIIIVNAAGEIRFVNPAATVLLDRKKEELLGEVFGFPIAVKGNTEFSLIRKNGALVYVDIQVVEIEWEKSKALLASLRDITNQKKVEEELRLSLRRFDLVMQASNDGLWEWDTQERVFYSPRFKELLGCSEQEIEDELAEFQARLHPEDNDRLWAAVGNHLEKRSPFDIEYRLKHKNGEYRWFRARGQAEWDPQTGKAVRMAGSISDQTDRKKAEEQFRQAQKMEAVGRLAGGIAHDFNNLLTVISGYTEMCLAMLEANSPLLPNIEEINKASKRAEELTYQLLAFSRRQVIQPKIVNLNEPLTEMNKMMRRIITAQIDLIIIPSKEIWPVKIDLGQFQQVLINLVVNARDAMPEGGKLIVELKNVVFEQKTAAVQSTIDCGKYVLLAVSDTGSGMSEAVKQRIFEPFFTTKEQGKGTGLGLATCYGIVQQAGGHISVYSEQGKGTSFKIYFPVAEGIFESLVTKAPSAVLPRGDEVILLVEDDVYVKRFASEVLRKQGYEVLESSNGQEALQLMSKKHGKKISLILTDLVMPRMGGKELAEKIGDLDENIKILYTSGYTDALIEQGGVLEAGVKFLQKPYSPKELALKIREVLDEK